MSVGQGETLRQTLMAKYYGSELGKSRKEGLASPSGSRALTLRTSSGAGHQELTVQDIQVRLFAFTCNSFAGRKLQISRPEFNVALNNVTVCKINMISIVCVRSVTWIAKVPQTWLSI